MTVKELNDNYFDFCFNCFSLGAEVDKDFSAEVKEKYEESWKKHFKYWQSLNQSIDFFSKIKNYFIFKLPLMPKETISSAPSGDCYLFTGMRHLLENHIPGKIVKIQNSAYTVENDIVYLITVFNIS